MSATALDNALPEAKASAQVSNGSAGRAVEGLAVAGDVAHFHRVDIAFVGLIIKRL